MIVKHVNNKIEISIDEQFWGFLTLSNNIERDVFVLCFREYKKGVLDDKVKKEEEK